MKANMIKGGVAITAVALVSAVLGTAVVRSQTTGDALAKAPDQVNMQEMKNTHLAFNFPDYSTIPADKAEQQTAQVLEQRSAAISKLTLQVEDPQMPKAAKAETIYLLGALRAPEAVTTLIENINFVDDRKFDATRISDRGGYIARRALRQIGEPSARWIYLIIANDHNLETVKFNKSQVDGFAEVLSGIETPEFALMKLQKGLAKAKDPKVKTQYQMVIERLRAKMPRTTGRV